MRDNQYFGSNAKQGAIIFENRQIKRSFLFAIAFLWTLVGMSVVYAGEPAVSTLKIQQIRNATIKITFGGKTILVDPMLAAKNEFPPLENSFSPNRPFPLVDLPLPVDEIIKADAVIVTHLHGDHFDQKAIESLPKGLPIIAQDDIDAATLRDYGFTNVSTMKYEGIKLGDITIHKTDCVHGEKETSRPYYEALNIRWEASGFVLKHPEEDKVVYIAGDTIWSEGVQYALKYFKPDVVVVNVAGAQWLTSGRIIMDLRDLVEVIRATPDTATIVASHLDAVGHATVSREDVRNLVNEYNFSKVLIPEDGEILPFKH